MATISEMLAAAEGHLKDKNLEDAMSLLEVAVRRAPRSGRVLKLYGMCLFSSGETERALDVLQTAHLSLPEDADLCHDLALAHLANNDLNSGLGLLEKALSLEPNSAKIHSTTASFLTQTGDLDNAIKHAVAAIQLNPDEADLHTDLGRIFASTGALFDAHTCFRKAVELDPKNEEAKHQLSKLLLDLGQFDEAIELAEEGYLAKPREPFTLANYAACLAQTGRIKESLPHIEKALQIGPHLPEIMEANAYLQALDGNPDVGIAHIAKEIKKNRDAVVYQLILAEAFAYTGRQREAVDIVLPFLAIPNASTAARTILRHCLLQLGEFDRANEIDRALMRGDIEAALGDAAERISSIKQTMDIGALAQQPSSQIPTPPVPNQATVDPSDDTAHSIDGIVINHEIKPLDALVLSRFLVEPDPTDDDDFFETEADRKAEQTPKARKVVFAPENLFPALSRIVSQDQLRDVDTLKDVEDGFTFQYLSDYGLSTCIQDYEPSRFKPYVKTDKAYDQLWDQSLKPFKRPHVGICWSRFPPGAGLDDIQMLMDGFDGTLFSLVWDDLRMELDGFPGIIDIGVHLKSLEALVDATAKMDAVVAADSMPLHYAGAMGVPGIALITPKKAWYWHENERQSFWYPSVRIVERPWEKSWRDMQPEFTETLDTIFPARKLSD